MKQNFENKIESSEWIYISLSVLMIFILFIMSSVDMIYKFITSLNPIIQFIIVNLGLYFAFFFLFKYIAIGEGKSIWTILEGSLANFLLYFSFDILAPEFHITTAGNLIPGGIFGQSASDYFIGYIYQQLFHITGLLLWFLVYPVTFIALFVLGAYLFKDFVKKIN